MRSKRKTIQQCKWVFLRLNSQANVWLNRVSVNKQLLNSCNAPLLVLGPNEVGRKHQGSLEERERPCQQISTHHGTVSLAAKSSGPGSSISHCATPPASHVLYRARVWPIHYSDSSSWPFCSSQYSFHLSFETPHILQSSDQIPALSSSLLWSPKLGVISLPYSGAGKLFLKRINRNIPTYESR